MVESKVTRSFFLNPRTAEPTSAIVPAASWPITIGGMRRPEEPSNPWTSLPPHRMVNCKRLHGTDKDLFYRPAAVESRSGCGTTQGTQGRGRGFRRCEQGTVDARI